MLRVAVAGVRGRMGTLAKAAIEAADDLAFAGGLARDGDLGELIDRERPDVLIDVTTHPATVAISSVAIDRGVSPVIGTSGWTASEREDLAERAHRAGVGAMLVPNFAIGAILMMRFAEMAARFFPTAEIVELHHDKKKDAPSGTSRMTAERIEARSGMAVPIHSVRLRGLVAHQEVLFGGDGETLTIRHDSFSRDSFAIGMLAAVRAVRGLRELSVGLDALIKENL